MGWLCKSHDFSSKENNHGKRKLLLQKPLTRLETDLILRSSEELSSQLQSIPSLGGAVWYIAQDILIRQGTQGRRRNPLYVSKDHTTSHARLFELRNLPQCLVVNF